MKMRISHGATEAFTRIELAVVLLTLICAAALALPAVGNTRSGADVAACFDHNRQLAVAWIACTLDNDDTFPSSAGADPGEVPNPWGQGYLDWGSRTDNTNATYLTDPKYSVLAEFLGRRKEPFKCPADRFLSGQQVNLGYLERVRSVAGNGWLGYGFDGIAGPSDDPYVRSRKFSQLLRPPPSQVFTFFEEHPDSLGDCIFYAPGGQTNSLQWWDYPGNYHDGAAMLAFADGRAELHRWVSGLRTERVRYGFNISANQSSQEDARYLYLRTPKQVR
jgi:prepilin-type processing-associated H-X9-DG protein